MGKWKKKNILQILLIVCLGVSIALPIGITNSYYMYIIDLILIYAILSLGLDLLVGRTGQVSLGHGAFFGIGAYTAAILSTKANLSLWLTLPSSIIITAVLGLVIGYIALKLKEDYLVMATLAFGTIVWLVFLNWKSVTRGPMGISSIPAPPAFHLGAVEISFNGYKAYYFLLLVFVVLAIVVTRLLMNSGFGRACTAIRDDELAAQAMGIPVFRTKVSVFTISAAFCGAGGALYAHFIHLVSPETFTFATSITILTMVMIGGKGSIAGAIVGSAFLTVSSEVLRAAPEWRMLVYGLLLVIMMMYFPRGIMGLIQVFRKRGEDA
jgi:branched-chain amino acid transport system permease protein